MKLGPHVLTRSDAAMRWVRRAPVVKAVNDPTPLQEAPADSWRVFRYYFADQSLARSPVNLASILILALRGYRHPKLLVELYNEVPRQLTPEYADLIAQTVPILHDHGLKVAGPSWATGDYDAEHWQYLRERNWCGLSAVSVHCYWADAGFTPYNALRFRQFWRPGDPPVIITEAGRDKVRDAPGGGYSGQGGWKRDGVSAEQYVSELVAYDAELERNPYVLGATVFSAGATPDWDAFNTDPMSDLLLARLPTQSQTQKPTQSGGIPVTQAEFDRYCADIWKRAGVPYNPQSALATYWREQLRRGRYLGRPEEPEHPTENGQYVVQAFAGAILHCRVGEWIVRESLPPLSGN